MSPNRTMIVVMAKTPALHRVKTRLQADIGSALALEVARAVLADTVDNALAVTPGVVVSAAGDQAAMSSLVPDATVVRPQVGADLAAGLANAQRDAFTEGVDAVMLLGADCPTAEPALLRAALARLSTATAVLGPAADGGYTLLAATRPTPELFAGIPMGRPDVAERTRAAASSHGVALAEVSQRHDLDVLSDLTGALVAGQLESAPRTRALAVRVLARHSQ